MEFPNASLHTVTAVLAAEREKLHKRLLGLAENQHMRANHLRVRIKDLDAALAVLKPANEEHVARFVAKINASQGVS